MVSKDKARRRIEKLKKVINEARYNYHVLDRSIMSDSALDSLKHELYKLEQEYPDLVTPDSPTQRIEGEPLDKFRKVEIPVKQYSFNDVFEPQEMRDFDDRVKRELQKAGVISDEKQDIEYSAEPKIDGMHVILTYEKGVFALGTTRGNGRVGEDVTQNLKTMEALPLRLREDVDIVVEGEVFMRKSVFEELNKKREEEGIEPLANPRNAAAGGIRQLDPKIAAQRNLDIFIYNYASSPSRMSLSTQIEELKRLMDLGFKVNKHFKLCRGPEEVIEYWKLWDNEKEEEDYWIDGIVAKVNNKDYQEKLGYTGKAPRWAIAFKWPGERETTILKDVKFQVGKTGRITPVAILDPVKIRGTVISRATLHNMDEIERLEVKIGDTVVVEKAGDIIPQVVEALPELRPSDAKSIEFPTKCPICDSEIVQPEGEVDYYCSNKECGAVQRQRLYYLVSQEVFDIEGLGPQIIDQLMDEGLVFRPADIFTLKEGDLKPLERFAEKSSYNLISSIQDSKKITVPKLILACNISGIGYQTARLILEGLNPSLQSISDFIKFFKEINQEELENIKGVGPEIAKSLKEWFSNEKNVEFLESLEEVGVEVEPWESIVKSKKLKNQSFVFTGSLESMTRNEAEKKARELGGKAHSSVSQNTDFLVVGEDKNIENNTKYKKAKELEIKTINEEDFLEMIK